MSLTKTIQDRPWILAVAVTLLVALWMGSGRLSEQERLSSQSATVTSEGGDGASLIRVEVATQIAERVTRTISVYGSTAPARAIELNAETEGRIVAIPVRRGQQVQRGDVLLRLDLRDREARLTQAEASVREHQTAYEAQMQLKSQGYVSETQIAETQAKLEGARAELTRAKLDLEYMVVRAPFNGVILERDVEIGDFVRAGDPLASFVDNTSIIVTGSIAEQDVRHVRADNPATARLVTGEDVTGLIRYVAPVADAATRTFTVEMEVPNPDGTLAAGVTAEMLIPADEMLAHKVAPSLLSLDSNGVIGIKTIDELNRVVFTPVSISSTDPDGVWITGLAESASIITLGQGYVAAGQQVDPVPAHEETALAAESRK